jgi:hypothetical protein
MCRTSTKHGGCFVDVTRYCNGVVLHCTSNGFSFIECYAHAMVAPNALPQDIAQSIEQKINEFGGIDPQAQITNIGPPPQ